MTQEQLTELILVSYPHWIKEQSQPQEIESFKYERAASILWSTITKVVNQEQVEQIERLCEKELKTLGILEQC